MSEEREEVYQILELGKHLKNLHHKKGFGGLLFIDLSMIKFSKLSSYIRQLDKENQELKKQLHDASIQIQELIEKDIWCPSNCEKLEKLEQENKQLQEELEWAIGIVEHNRIISKKNKEIHQLKKQLEEINKMIEKCGFVNIEQVMLSYCGLIAQQKEFIKWLEDYLNLFDYRDIQEQAGYDMLEEILQKYREVIGVSDEKK